MAQDVPSFSDAKVHEALDSAKKFYQQQHTQALQAQTSSTTLAHDDGHLATRAECITLTISNGQVCVNLPLGIGKVCLPVPISYNGQVASVCLDICTTMGFPTGVKVTVTVAGIQIVQKSFGKC
jgi:hypothetical protein